MAFNTQKFRAELAKSKFAQPNHFEIQFVGEPPKLPFQQKELDIFYGMRMKAFSTQLPGMVIDTIERRYHGPTRLIPTGFAFQQLPLMIYETSDHVVRGMFDTWMYGIAENKDWFVRYYDDIIVKEMRLSLYEKAPQQDSAGEALPVKTYIFEEVYPISVSAVQLDWSANNTMMGVSVDLQYHRWSIL